MPEVDEEPIDIEQTLKEVRDPSQFIPTEKPGPRYRTQNFREAHNGKNRFLEDHHDRSDVDQDGVVSYIKGIDDKEKEDRKTLRQDINDGLRDYDEFDLWVEEEEVEEDTEEEIAEKIRLKKIYIETKHKRNEKIEAAKRYRWGVGQTIGTLKSAIELDPDMSEEDLLSLVDSQAYGIEFSPKERELFQKGIAEYRRKHQAVEREIFITPYADELYVRCFGKQPKGKITILKHPMTIVFQCEDDQDFLWAGEYSENGGVPYKIDTSQSRFLTSAGLALYSSQVPDLEETLILERRSITSENPNLSERIILHEDQHHFNKLFVPLNEEVAVREMMLRAVITSPDLKGTTNKFLGDYMRLKRRSIGIDERARNEILALIAGGTDSVRAFAKLATDPAYNYYAFPYYKPALEKIPSQVIADISEIKREWVEDKLTEDFGNREIPNPDTISPDQIKQKMDEAFVDRYKRDLRKWLDSVGTLARKGYKNEEIVEMLYPYPAPFWHKVARDAQAYKHRR